MANFRLTPLLDGFIGAAGICSLWLNSSANAIYMNNFSVVGGTHLLSQEGTTHGDPWQWPCLHYLQSPYHKNHHKWIQANCYADDAASGRKLFTIRKWWQRIIDIGPKYSYHPNQSKSWLIVKPKHLNQAQHLFSDRGI